MPSFLRQFLSFALTVFISASGLFAQNQKSAKSAEETVKLPSFVIEDRAVAKPKLVHWLHAEIPGIEILSGLSRTDTIEKVNALNDQIRLLNWTLPPELQPEPRRPLQLILDDDPRNTLQLQLTAKIKPLAFIATPLRSWDFASYYWNESDAPNPGSPHLSETWSASTVIFAALASIEQMPRPSWLPRFWGTSRGLNYFVQDDSVVFAQKADSLVGKDLPLPSLNIAFADPNWRSQEPKPAIAPAVEAGRWFVRWALFSDQGAYRRAFWRFVQAATLQPQIDDAFLRKNLGLSIAELDEVVGKFRRASQANPNLRFKLPLGPESPPPVVRDATDAEISRILGQWTLLAAREIPDLNTPLHFSARLLLTQAGKQNSRAPQITALLGLIELAAGNTEKARTLLESVAAFPELNLRARFELGKLRYLEALAKLTTPADTFDAKQVASILAPLTPFLNRAPGESDPLVLVAQTWLRAATPPTPDELIALIPLVRQFPRDDQLLLQIALLCTQKNLDASATELITIGIANSTKEQVRGALIQLQQHLAARAAK
jgi:hypothetical protein